MPTADILHELGIVVPRVDLVVGLPDVKEPGLDLKLHDRLVVLGMFQHKFVDVAEVLDRFINLPSTVQDMVSRLPHQV